MKKLILLVLVAFCSTSIFSQSAEYTALLKKAKDYEAKGEYVYALGTYYDAVATEQTSKGIEAYNAFNSLAGKLSKGSMLSVKGDEEDFLFWYNLKKNYNKYWTENCPRTFHFSELTKKTGTSYSVKIDWELSKKCLAIISPIYQGYMHDCYIYKWSNTEFVTSCKFYPDSDQLKAVMDDCAIAYEDYNMFVTAAFATYDWYDRGFDRDCNFTSEPTGYTRNWTGTLNDLKFSICDESGNILLTSSRYLVGMNYGEYIFESVPSSVATLIDQKKVKFKIQGLFLECGNCNRNYKSDRSWIKPLPELQISTSNVVFTSPYEPSVKDKDFIQDYISIIMQSGNTDLINSYLSKLFISIPANVVYTAPNSKRNVVIALSSINMSKEKVSEQLYNAIWNVNEEKKTLELDSLRDSYLSTYLRALDSYNFSDDFTIGNYKMIAFCNKLSILAGRSPYYIIKSVDFTELEYDEIPTSYNSRWNKISVDKNSNGFRLPTEVELLNAINIKGKDTFLKRKRLPYSQYDDYTEENMWEYENLGEAVHKFYDDEITTRYENPGFQFSSDLYNELSGSSNGFRVCFQNDDWGSDIKEIYAEIDKEKKEAANNLVQMIPIEGDTFIFGDEFDEYEKHPEIAVSSFYMSKTEVTQKLYNLIMNLPASTKGSENLPASKVTLKSAVIFCNRLSELKGLSPCYIISKDEKTIKWIPSANGYRLPTEAEWEYAAKGGKYHSTYEYSGKDSISKVAWYYENSNRTIHPVGELLPNKVGLYDMSGNVTEYFWPSFLYPGERKMSKNPFMEKISFDDYNYYNSGNESVSTRGGSFNSYEYSCKVFTSEGVRFSECNQNGIRLCQSGEEFIETYRKTIQDKINSNLIQIDGGTISIGEKSISSPSLYVSKTELFSDFLLISEKENFERSIDSFSKTEFDITKDLTAIDAVYLCNNLSIYCGYTPCYIINSDNTVSYNADANGYRLPTKEEWEYLARGGLHNDQFRYSGSDNIKDVAWYKNNSEKSINVGARYETCYITNGHKKPNSLGLYDMSGNTGDWCYDNGEFLLAGGDVTSPAEECTVSSFKKAKKDSYGGLRLCRTAE